VIVRPQASATPVVEIEDLVVAYGGVRAVDGVTLSVSAGEVLGIVGPNGAGKSSLLAAVGGQLQPSRGRIRLEGVDVTRLPPHRRAQRGVVRTFQDTSEFGRLTVFENLLVAGLGKQGASLLAATFGAKAQARRSAIAAARAAELISRFELDDLRDAYAMELSGGQRRLVEVMRCLMRDPRLLLLDEPTVGVAPHLSEQLRREYRKIAASGVAVLMIEHVLEVVEEVCDRVVVMDNGAVIAEGTFDEVMRSRAVHDAYLG
jgi:neutral amino acid transport system ATP-binding protein